MEEVAKEKTSLQMLLKMATFQIRTLWFFDRNIDDPTLKAITKWKNHPSILATASEYTNRENFCFNFVSKGDFTLGVNSALR